MRRWMGGLAAGGLALGMAGCVLPLNITIGDDGTHVRGSGHVVTVSRHVGSFDAIVASVTCELCTAHEVTHLFLHARRR